MADKANGAALAAAENGASNGVEVEKPKIPEEEKEFVPSVGLTSDGKIYALVSTAASTAAWALAHAD